jgi:hypothetical protein
VRYIWGNLGTWGAWREIFFSSLVFVFGPATILIKQSSKQKRRVDQLAGHNDDIQLTKECY